MGHRVWSLLFLSVPIWGIGSIVWAIADLPGMERHWLPANINDYGQVIDSLFNFILYLTGAIFIGTGLVQFWFLWKYDAQSNDEPIKFVHGNHALELIWSLLPAVTLLFISFVQLNAWADQKMRRPILSAGPDGVEGTADDILKPPLVEVTGRQFEWRYRYAGKDGVIGTRDDVHGVSELVLPMDEDVVLAIKSEDVLHSFFLPNLRVKQDVVPGMKQFVWFRANQAGIYDIVCAELCGWGHYKMRGLLRVLPSQEDFDQWLQTAYEAQELKSYTPDEEAE